MISRPGKTWRTRCSWSARNLLGDFAACFFVTGTAVLTMISSPAASADRHKLLVISVDGLDWRYLRDRNKLGLKIPTLRRFMAGAETADGVVGVWPTITWPSHTTIVTGVRPDQHGIFE